MTALTMPLSERKASDSAAEGRIRSQKSRVQFDLTPRSMERLNTLKLKMEASSYAEVVKNALRLYEALIEETESGKEFLVRDKTGVVAPYKLFL